MRPTTKRLRKSVVLASFLLAGVSQARADTITYDTTPFAGQTTDLTSVGNVYSFPFTDSYGNVLHDSANAENAYTDSIIEGLGWIFGAPFVDELHSTLTFTLASATTKIGFAFDTGEGSDADYLTTATFSDGVFTDTFTGGPSDQPNSVPFMSFTDDRPFTAVTLSFNYEDSKTPEVMTSFTTAATRSVPEPASVGLVGLGLAGIAARAVRKRKGHENV